MAKLADSVVVVTGASGGIGRATALAFAERGATVVVTARRSRPLDDVVRECRRADGEAVAVPADVTDDEAVDAVAREAAGRFGRIDVWVNNAGVNLYGPIEEAPPREWRRVVETNVFGTYHGIRAALPWMREQGHGVLVNVSSVLGKVGSPYQSAYVASKHAVRGLSDCVRQEVGDVAGIEVCTVLPGPIDTPLFDHAATYTSRRPKPIKPVIDAHRVAESIVACARRPRREVVVGASSRNLLGWNRLVPGGLERVVARQVERDHFADEPAQPRSGNLFEPVDNGHVSGGWTRRSRKVAPTDRRAASNTGGARRGVRLLAVAGAAAAAAATVRAFRR